MNPKALLKIFLLSLLPLVSTAQSKLESKVDLTDSLFRAGRFEELITEGQSIIRNTNSKDTLNIDFAHIILNIGRAYIQLEAFPDAVRYNTRALGIFKYLNDSMGVARTYGNLAGVYYYRRDSALAFKYQQEAKPFYPKSASVKDKQTYAFMEALLFLEFGTPEKGLEMVDSLLLQLESNSPLFLNVSASVLDRMDSLEFLVRFPVLLTKLQEANLSPDFEVTVFGEIMERAHQLGRPDILHRFTPDLAASIKKLGSNASVSQLATYHYLLALDLAYQKDYQAAFAEMQQYSKLLKQKDSIQGAEDLKNLEIQVRLKDAALNARDLETALKESRWQVFGLVLLVLISIIIIFLIYRVNRDTKERKLAIEEVASTRGKMLSILSHDLRTPLSQLEGTLKLYESGDLSTEDLQLMMPEIRKTSSSTLKLLDRTVAWINVNRSDFKLHLEIVDIETLFEELKDLIGKRAEDKNINFKTQVQVERLEADRFLLSTALFNLLSNAFKFVNPDGAVTLRAYEQGENLVFEVSDSGRGISVDNLAKIRQEITVSSQGTLSEQSGGLGLTIVRDTCRKLEARFEIDSVEGEGTQCRIVF